MADRPPRHLWVRIDDVRSFRIKDGTLYWLDDVEPPRPATDVERALWARFVKAAWRTGGAR